MQFDGVQAAMATKAAGATSIPAADALRPDEEIDPASAEDEGDMGSSGDLKKVSQDEMMERAMNIAETGGHTLLLGPTSGLWQQVVAFLRPLRAAYLARKFPVIVAIPDPCPMHVSQIPGFADVAFVDMQPWKIESLKKLRVEKANKVMVLAGRPLTEDARMVDSKAVVMANTLEIHLGMYNIKCLTAEMTIVYEFFKMDNLRLLTPLEPLEGEIVPHSSDVKYSWRYTNGSVIFPCKMGALFAMAFYTPGIMEIFEALSIPSRRDQVSMPWRICIPSEYHGKTYLELLKALTSGKLAHDEAQKTGKEIKEDVLGANKHKLGAIPLGLYRPEGSNGSALGYIFTNPPANTVLLDNEYVFCSAPKEWGHTVVHLLGAQPKKWVEDI